MATLKVAIVPVTPFEQNCSIVWDADTMRAAIVDPGGDLPRIQGAIADLKVLPEKILLTHGHIDHAGGAAELAELLSIPIEGSHEDDAPLLANLTAQAQRFGLAGVRPVTPTRWLKEGDTVTVGGLTFDVLHVPGHAPATWCSSTPRPNSPSLATPSSRVPSAAPTCRAATMTCSSAASRRRSCRWGTTSPCSPAMDRRPRWSASASPTRFFSNVTSGWTSRRQWLHAGQASGRRMPSLSWR